MSRCFRSLVPWSFLAAAAVAGFLLLPLGNSAATPGHSPPDDHVLRLYSRAYGFAFASHAASAIEAWPFCRIATSGPQAPAINVLIEGDDTYWN